MSIDPAATKYLVRGRIIADGVVDKPDVVGAIFGQTEGLLGDRLDLRDLQKSGKIGRIEVDITSKGGKSDGLVLIYSSLDQVETAILASALETVDRVGPCKASIKVSGIEDVRITKREMVVDRAKELLLDLMNQSKAAGGDITEIIRQSVQIDEITTYGSDNCPAGPNVADSEAIIIVEGRSDVINLLKAGIKNAIAVEGTNVPKTVQELSKEKVTTAFVDGDRGGELILRELFQVADIDFVARAPRAHEVEELSAKQLVKCLRNKMPGDQYMEMNGFVLEAEEEEKKKDEEKPVRERRSRREEEKPRSSRFDTEATDRFRKRLPEDEGRPLRSLRGSDEEEKPIRERKPKFEEPENDDEEKPVRVRNRHDEEKPVRERKAKTETERTPKGKKPVSEKILSPEQVIYRDYLRELSSTHNAKLLDNDNNVISELPVKSMVDTLKTEDSNIATIVFDGIISQRIVDVASEKNIGIVVGVKKGNITKMPAGITFWTKEDLN